MGGNISVFGNSVSISSGTTTEITTRLPNTNCILHKLRVNAPGVSAETAIYGYDGVSGTSSIPFIGGVFSGTGALIGSPVPLAAIPSDGWLFGYSKGQIHLSTGSISLVFVNNTQDAKTVYLAGEYQN